MKLEPNKCNNRVTVLSLKIIYGYFKQSDHKSPTPQPELNGHIFFRIFIPSFKERERETERETERDRETALSLSLSLRLSLCVLVCLRQRDRETERQRDRETELQRDRVTGRQRETERQGKREREGEREKRKTLHCAKGAGICIGGTCLWNVRNLRAEKSTYQLSLIVCPMLITYCLPFLCTSEVCV